MGNGAVQFEAGWSIYAGMLPTTSLLRLCSQMLPQRVMADPTSSMSSDPSSSGPPKEPSGTTSTRQEQPQAATEPECEPGRLKRSKRLEREPIINLEAEVEKWIKDFDEATNGDAWEPIDNKILILLARRKDIWLHPHGPNGPKECVDKRIIDFLLEFDIIDTPSKRRDSVANLLIEALGPKLAAPHGHLQRTALHQAVANERDLMVSHLLSHSECTRFIKLGDVDGRTAIHEAAARGNETILKNLLRVGGAQLNTPDSFGMTPLHLVIWLSETEKDEGEKRLQRSEIIKFLIEEEGAEVNTRDQLGKSPPC